MTSTKKAAYTNPARRIFLSLGQLFHETRTAYASATVEDRTDLDALDAGPEQLEQAPLAPWQLATTPFIEGLTKPKAGQRQPTDHDRILQVLTTVIRMNDKVGTMAQLLKEQQLRISYFNTCMLRLDTVLELTLNRSELPIQLLANHGRDAGRDK